MPCVVGKRRQRKFRRNLIPCSCTIGDIIVSDVCGSFNHPTWSNSKYLTTFIDEKYNFTHEYTIKSKTLVPKTFKQYVSMLITEKCITARRLHTDNVGEYLSKGMDDFCREKEYCTPKLCHTCLNLTV